MVDKKHLNGSGSCSRFSPVRPEFNYHKHDQQWLKVERNCCITRGLVSFLRAPQLPLTSIKMMLSVKRKILVVKLVNHNIKVI